MSQQLSGLSAMRCWSQLLVAFGAGLGCAAVSVPSADPFFISGRALAVVLQFSGTGMVTILEYGVSHGTSEDVDLVQVCWNVEV